jgi:hypothetical protein
VSNSTFKLLAIPVLVVIFILYMALVTKPRAQINLTGAEILSKDLAYTKAARDVASGCVAYGETVEKVQPILPMIVGQLCGPGIQTTLSRIDNGRGECTLDNSQCLFNAGCIRAAAALEELPSGTPEEQAALVAKCDGLFSVYKAAKSSK